MMNLMYVYRMSNNDENNMKNRNTNKTDSHALRVLINEAKSDMAIAQAANDVDTVEGLVLHIEELEQDFNDVQSKEDGEREAREQE